MSDHHIPAVKCIKCGELLDQASPGRGKVPYPRPGDISVCAYCGNVRRFSSTLELEDLATGEWDSLDDALRKEIVEAQETLRKKKGKVGWRQTIRTVADKLWHVRSTPPFSDMTFLKTLKPEHQWIYPYAKKWLEQHSKDVGFKPEMLRVLEGLLTLFAVSAMEAKKKSQPSGGWRRTLQGMKY